MQIPFITINKKAFASLDEDDRLFLIQILHLITELDILGKCLLVSHNDAQKLPLPQKSAQLAQATFFIKELAGKLYEGRELIRHSYHGTRLAKKYNDILPLSSKESLTEILKYFDKNPNIVKIIRDKHAFHYDRDRAKQALILFPESEDLLFFLPQNGVNFFAEFAEDILNWSLFNEKPGISPSDTLNAIMQDVVSLKRHFETFGHQYAECVLQTIEHHGANSEDVDIPTINDVHLPFFVRRNNALEA